MRVILKQHGLGLKVEANMQVTDFLDVLFDLKQGTYRAWVKPEQVIHYMHRESNHPTQIHIQKNMKCIFIHSSRLVNTHRYKRMKKPLTWFQLSTPKAVILRLQKTRVIQWGLFSDTAGVDQAYSWE